MAESSRQDDNYWFAFEPAAWIRDTRVLSLAARGLWADLLAFAHGSPERGVVLHANGCAPDAKQMRRMCNCDGAELDAALDELLTTGVAARRDDGAIYSRRMARDGAKERRKSAAGRKAANMRWHTDAVRNDGQLESESESQSEGTLGADKSAPAGMSKDEKKDRSLKEHGVVCGFYRAYKDITGQDNSHTPTDGRLNVKDRMAARRWLKKGIDPKEANVRLRGVLAGRYYKTAPDTFAAFEAMYDSLIPANRKKAYQQVNETPGAERSGGAGSGGFTGLGGAIQKALDKEG